MNLNTKSRSGILLHPTALPGPYGIGDIGPHAYRFIDDLHDMGQSLWQILPIVPTDYCNSPYSSISTFAGNHLLISLDLLVEDGLLKSLDVPIELNCKKINFDKAIDFKIPILKQVSKNFKVNASPTMKGQFENFCIENSYWLDDYSKYLALREENNNISWISWKSREPNDINLVQEAKIIQFIFHDQWNRLRDYCRNKEVKIIGDMPIYVSYDSADTYSNRNLFQLDELGRMIFQSGCPPCEYQKKGQLWRTPLYDWENHEKTNFEWWQNRFRKLFEMVDIVRLDHFIGYAKYYRIPIKDQTACDGEWLQAPGDKLFQVLDSTSIDFNVIAEDLGDITEDVINLRDKYQFPGMRVLQFEFEKTLKNNFFKNSLVCTGTHDNDTIMGWFESLSSHSDDENILTKSKLLNFFKCKKNSIHWKVINYALSTASDMVIVPMQDLLGKNSSSRFNTPGILSDDNWSWRMEENSITQSLKDKLIQ